jgi:DNA-binding SARP family transcriptional activator/predicted Zn-dependent protease
MVTLRILGPIELTGGRRPGELLRHPRDLAVLSYVVVMGAGDGHCTRDQVAATFWPESDEKRARNALNQALHRIRRATAEDVFTGHGQGLSINRGWVQADVDAFWRHLTSHEAEAAVALYRGELLSGMHIARAGPFEDWLEKERARHKGSARDATRGLREAAAGQGALDLAIGFARRAAEISDREEEDIRRLVEYLARSGDRVAARREYEQFARWLKAELELEPSPETIALVASVLGETSTATNDATSGRLTHPPPASPPTRTAPYPFAEGRPVRRRRLAVASVAALAAVVASALLLIEPDGRESPIDLGLSEEAMVYYERGDEYTRAGNIADREENWRLALEMYQRASEVSPRSAAAHASVGVAHLRLFHWGVDRSTERQVMAKSAIDRGSAMDPDHPVVNRALGWYYQWGERDYARSREAGQRVLEVMPGDVGALTLVFAANRRVGRAAEALPAVQELVRVTGSAAYWSEWATTLIGLREYEQALRVLEEALGLFPNHGGLHYQRWETTLRATGDPAEGARVLSEARERLGPQVLWPWEFGQLWLSRRYQEALAVLEREEPATFQTQQGDFPVDLMVGRVQRLAGRESEARASYGRSVEPLRTMLLARPDEPWVHGWLAIALAGAGEREAALAQVDAAKSLAELEPDLWENPYMMQEVVLHTYVLAGEHDRAIKLLTELLDSRHYRALSRRWVAMDPRLDPLRDHPMWGVARVAEDWEGEAR